MKATTEPRWFSLLTTLMLPVAIVIFLKPDNGFSWIVGMMAVAILISNILEKSRYFADMPRYRLLTIWAPFLVFASRSLLWYAYHGRPFWVLASLALIGSIPLRTWLVKLAQPSSGRECLVRCGLGGGLFLFYVLLRPDVIVLQSLLLLFVSHDLYVVAFLLVMSDAPITFRRFSAFGGSLIFLAVAGSKYHLNPLFHVLVVRLVAGTISIAFESTLDRKGTGLRIGIDRLLIHAGAGTDFLRTMQKMYSPVIIGVETLGLMAVVAFNLPALLVRSNMQGNVFESSLSLVGILIAVIIFLKERGAPGSTRIALNGLWSIVALFLTIAAAAFIVLAISSGGATLNNLPDFGQLTMINLFTTKDIGFRALILGLYEGLFYAVLIGIVCIGSVIRDVLKHEDEGDSENMGQLVLPDGK